LTSIEIVSSTHGSPTWLITMLRSGKHNATSSTRIVRWSRAGFIGPGTPTLMHTGTPRSHAAV
jgi:hypothetical protein